MADNAKKPEAPNPAQAFGEMVTQWERNFDAFANQVMGTEAYSQAMNEAQKAQLGAQRSMQEFFTGQLESMNMPTREDVVQLTELVRNLDLRLERIEEKLALNDTPKSKKRPARTRVPKAPESEAPAKKRQVKANKAENTDPGPEGAAEGVKEAEQGAEKGKES